MGIKPFELLLPYKLVTRAIAELEKVQTVKLAGTLGIYEEYSEAVTKAIQNCL